MVCVARSLTIRSHLIAISRSQFWPTPACHGPVRVQHGTKGRKTEEPGEMAQLAMYFLSHGHEDVSSYSQKSPEWWLLPVTQQCGEKAGTMLAE